MSNYFFLYKADTGEIYSAPYLGDAQEWTNIPDGCAVLGPYPQDSAASIIVDAWQNPQYYIVQNGAMVQKPDASDMELADAKARKIVELDQACKQTILGIFQSSATGVTYTYSCDDEAQRNFANAKAMFDINPNMAGVNWTTKEAGQVYHTKEQFYKLFSDGFSFIQVNVDRYHSLDEQRKQCTAIDQVNAIVW